MKRLSSPITDLKPEYEVVVVGSGYGGGIAASRMSRIKRKVCVLEKGKEFMPGDYPENLAQASKEMQINKGSRRIGPENGLYEFVIGEDISVLKGCGLGGTSLINANVSIEAEERVFLDERWPREIREDVKSVKDGISRAWEMLKPNPYPEGKNGYKVLAKTTAMRKSAEMMREKFRLLDINVNFEDKINHVGVEQNKCVNCGNCVTGCNHQAKNNVHMNYLPDAKNHGAEIFTNIAVSHVERAHQKWLVYFDICGSGRKKFDAPKMFIKADQVFLCAGALGSTEILLRSAAHGLSLSETLGTCFTGNGDVLGFGYNCDQKINGIGRSIKPSDKEIADIGPCITSAIDMRNTENLEDGMTLEEGSVPGGIKSVLRSALMPMSRLFGLNTDRGIKDTFSEKWREIISMIRGAYYGSLNNTQIYLVMTHDDCQGRMTLKNDRIRIDWKGVGKQKIFEKVSGELLSASRALGGTYLKNPTWSQLMKHNLMTVHPLGGCVMGGDASKAVVDHKGQVFSGTTGKNLHKGLYVLDGAIIPRSVGTNPLLTISGLAERACAIIAKEFGTVIDYSFPPVKLLPADQTVPGVQFTETMTGYFSKTEKSDFVRAFEQGKANDSPFEFTMTIQVQDIDQFISAKESLAGMIGSVKAPALSDHPMMACAGTFNLFASDPADKDRKRMDYSMLMIGKEGKNYRFEGFKDIKDDKGVDVWKDTTVLFITVYSEDKTEVIGKGMLKIRPGDFVRQLETMKAINTKSKMEAWSAITKFGKFFAGNVGDVYFKKNKNKREDSTVVVE